MKRPPQEIRVAIWLACVALLWAGCVAAEVSCAASVWHEVQRCTEGRP